MTASIASNYPPHFSKYTVLLQFRQDLPYLKPHSQKSDIDTAQAMSYKTQTAPDITIRHVQIPFSKFQLLHERRLPEKPEILNIC